MNSNQKRLQDEAVGALLIAADLGIYTKGFDHLLHPELLSQKLFGQVGNLASAVISLGQSLADGEYSAEQVNDLRGNLLSEGRFLIR